MLIMAVSIVTVRIALIVDSHLLLRRFCARFPEEAKREIPYAGDWSMRHPEKGIFFFRKKATEILQADPVLLKHRKRVLTLFILAVAVPVLGMLILISIALATTGF
jgi:hypothetical protein